MRDCCWQAHTETFSSARALDLLGEGISCGLKEKTIKRRAANRKRKQRLDVHPRSF